MKIKRMGAGKGTTMAQRLSRSRTRAQAHVDYAAGKNGDTTRQTRLQTGKTAKPVIFSIGYEGKTITLFISMLKSAGAKQLIDVRENPFSFKKGFSKAALMDNLTDARIKYQHIAELGTERQSRKEYRQTGDLSKLCRTFAKRLEDNRERYEYLVALAKAQESAIMCFEENYRLCHRQILEKNLEKDGFEVVHLCNGKEKRY